MRSVTQSLNLATTAVGSFLVIPLLYLVNANPDDEWVPSNVDNGHLDYYFFLLAALMVVTLFYFSFISAGYEYKTSRELSFLDDLDMSGHSLTSATNAKEAESVMTPLTQEIPHSHGHGSSGDEEEEVEDVVVAQQSSSTTSALHLRRQSGGGHSGHSAHHLSSQGEETGEVQHHPTHFEEDGHTKEAFLESSHH